jgi:hypothetical protein
MCTYTKQQHRYRRELVRLKLISKQNFLLVNLELMHKNPRQITLLFFANQGFVSNFFDSLVNHNLFLGMQFFHSPCKGWGDKDRQHDQAPN